MKILVTGALGFIGSNLVPELLNAGHEVIGFDNLANPSIKPFDRMKSKCIKHRKLGHRWDNFKFYELDVRNGRFMYSICANERPDIIVHLAALGSVPRSFVIPEEYIEVNEVGFLNMIALTKKLGCKKLIYASSSSVYGSNERMVKTEGIEGIALSPYAMSKKHNEDAIRLLGKNIEHIGLRFFNVYGPGQVPDKEYSAAIPKFIIGKEIVINGDGSAERDFTFVGDVCRAINLAIHTKNSNFIANIGTGQPTKILDLAKKIAKGKKKIVFGPDRPGDIKVSIADTINAKEKLGFEANTSLDEGLEKTMEYYKDVFSGKG